jgi:hypothetical protein
MIRSVQAHSQQKWPPAQKDADGLAHLPAAILCVRENIEQDGEPNAGFAALFDSAAPAKTARSQAGCPRLGGATVL